MDPKLEALLKAGFEASYALEDLSLPCSIRLDGEFATVADALREFGTEDVRALFGLSAPDGTQPIKSVNDLNEDELARLTIAMHEDDDGSTRLACGNRTYSGQDIIDEVRRRTPFGLETMTATLRYHQLNEEAIRRGKVRRFSRDALQEDIDTILKDF